ncbi:glycosyltransferase family 2 protein [Streptomyces fulvoviolaceus]|uniref:glycosyltransferase family 2 protein n=1 Tax=Streptomyces fulvoviolaceus TaxID=285535 RepID=UPI0021BE1601|nr:glycosyltransferase [Streptomyces fulvoviolaceus]MCT9078927.1 glycosyltransferase [Streptomyces fulvoviolaceus]
MLVSVIIPLYNTEKHIEACLASVLSQTHRELDVIVVDDGSTDGGAAIAESIADERIRVDRGPNRGGAAARNHGLDLAKGEIVAFLDADDLWYPDKLSEQISVLQSDRDVVAVGAIFQYLSGDGRRLLSQIGQDARDAGSRERLKRGQLAPFPINSCLIAWADTVRAAGGYDESLPVVEDIDLLSRLALAGSVATVMRPLGAYRFHSDSLSARHHARVKMFMRFVEQRATARLEGRPTPDLESFVSAYRPTRAQRRQDGAARRFRDAGMLAMEGRYVRATPLCALALAARPWYTLRRIAAHLSVRRTPSALAQGGI